MSTRDYIKQSAKATPHVIWPVRIIGLLLFVQALLVSGITVYFARAIDWEHEFNDIVLSLPALDIFMWAATLLPVILLLLLSSVAFLLYRRFAWLLAMTLQGLILLRCLILYFATASHLRDSPWVHIIMLYSIILVLYLNTTDIRLAFIIGGANNGHDDEPFTQAPPYRSAPHATTGASTPKVSHDAK